MLECKKCIFGKELFKNEFSCERKGIVISNKKEDSKFPKIFNPEEVESCNGFIPNDLDNLSIKEILAILIIEVKKEKEEKDNYIPTSQALIHSISRDITNEDSFFKENLLKSLLTYINTIR